MAVEVAAIIARLEADVRDFDRGMRSAEKRLEQLEGGAKKAKRGTNDLFKSMKKLAVIAGVGMGLRELKQFIGGTISAASDLEESINAVEVAMGDASKEVFVLGETSAEAMGISKTALNEAAVAFSAFGEKINAADVGGTFEDFIGRATDFASVMNLEVGDALLKFQSGLAGETEALRRFGIDVSAVSVESFALANGIAQAGEKMTEAQKIQARYGLLMQQTEKFAGDFANTSEGLANQQRILTATWEDAQAQIGQRLVPTMTRLVGVAKDLIPAFILIAEAAADAIVEIVDMVQPIIDLIEFVGDFADTSDDASESTGDFSFSIGTASTVLRNFATLGLPLAAQKYKELTGATDENAKAVMRAARDMKNAVDPIDLWGEALADAAVDADAATDAIDDLASELLAMSDPVFNAIDAMDNLSETLLRIDEDGRRTEQEMLELAKATLEAEAAFNAVDAGNIEATLGLLTKALGISEQAARDLLTELGILDGTAVNFEVRGTVLAPPGFTTVPSVPSIITPLSGVQQFHGGGIAGGTQGTREVLAVLERGEGVIDRDTMRTGIGGRGGDVIVNVAGSVMSERQLVNVVRDGIVELERRNGTSGL